MKTNAEKALVIHPVFKSQQNDICVSSAFLEEAVALSKSLGLTVVDTHIIKISTPRAGYLFGKGAVRVIQEKIFDHKLKLIVINGSISPIQQRNLERIWSAKIVDRTHLILEIFADRAATREGRLQVDLASLSYQRTRLVRSWSHLERQRGALGFVGGPGETQIESDRRAIDKAILRIKKQLKTVVKTRVLHRKLRKKVPYPIIALVGYTNAGKSTLFNLITKSKVYAEDRLFATLDPTMRLLELSKNNKAIISDTVGFISELPTELIAAFRATLEEVLEADLVIHVRDVSHINHQDQKKDVIKILNDLGIGESKIDNMIEVANKIDLLSDDELRKFNNINQRKKNIIPISSTNNIGISDLINAIEAFLNKDYVSETLSLSFDELNFRAKLYEMSIIESEEIHDDGYEISVRWSEKKRGEFFHNLNSNQS